MTARAASQISGRRVWVVGASSGIGAALATELAARGAEVAVSGRRADQLRVVSGAAMASIPVDVVVPEAVERAAEDVREALGGLDMVVWSAGYWKRFNAALWDREAFARHVEVNLLGMNNVLSAVIPGMAAAGHGHLVGIASVAGYRGLPGAEAYGATKAAQLYLLETLRASLGQRGVRVTTVSPGFVRTEMTAGNRFPMPFVIDPPEAARAIADGLERRRDDIVFPLPMAILMKTAKVLPDFAWNAVSSRLGRG